MYVDLVSGRIIDQLFLNNVVCGRVANGILRMMRLQAEKGPDVHSMYRIGPGDGRDVSKRGHGREGKGLQAHR